MLYNLLSSSLIIYLNVLELVKLISCWDLKEHHIIIIIIKKSERENFNRILTVLYLFAMINKILQIVSQQWR